MPMVTSPMGTASNCFARSLGADSTSSPGSSPVAGIHLYTLLLFFPSAGVHLRGAREEEEEEEEEEGGGRGEPRFRAPARFRLANGRAGGVLRTRGWDWTTHFFSQCLTRPSRICACERAASRWPRVDIVHARSPE